MRFILVLILLYIISLLFTFFCFREARAQSLEVFKPKAVTLELEYYDVLRDPYIPEYTDTWTYGTATTVEYRLIGNDTWELFYNPRLSFRSTESQIRQGALYFETGLRYQYKDITYRIYRRHNSQHVLEQGRDTRTYPLLDSYVGECRWNLN